MAGPPEKYPQPGKPYGGWAPVKPTAMQSRIGWAFGVTMWLWVFYRGKQDLPHLLVRLYSTALCLPDREMHAN